MSDVGEKKDKAARPNEQAKAARPNEATQSNEQAKAPRIEDEELVYLGRRWPLIPYVRRDPAVQLAFRNCLGYDDVGFDNIRFEFK